MLERLAVSSVDLLYLHAPDHNTDLETTMRVINDIHRCGSKIASSTTFIGMVG